MKALDTLPGPVEKITLEADSIGWVAFSTGSCGILVRAMIGRHANFYQENRSIARNFAQQVLQAMSVPPEQERASTAQILVETADALIDDPEHVVLLATTWQYLPEGVEICSVGSNSVLVWEHNTFRDVVVPHTANELLRSQGLAPDPLSRRAVTHVLGSKTYSKSCQVADVRVALVPLALETMIAIIESRLLADAILAHMVPANELPLFIESWKPQGRKIRTSVLISS